MGWAAAVGRKHASITQPPPPGGGSDLAWGPRPELGTSLANRVQAVKDGTSPLAIVHPGGSPTTVNPGDSIAAKITTAGTNGTLWFVKGTHSLSAEVAPLAGQTWVLESAAGYNRTASDSAVIDGGGGALNFLVASSALNVTIKGGVWQNQGNSLSATFAAAILAGGGSLGGGWLIQDAIVKNNYNRGIAIQAPNCTVRRVYMDNNGRYGPNCAENVSGETYTGIVFENCRWSNNNSRLLNAGDAAGGSKFLHCPGLIVRYCWVHDNHGFGIWADVPNVAGEIQFLENVVEHNKRSGLFFEGPMGGSRGYRNYVLNNGYDTTSIGGLAANWESCTQVRITHSDSTLGNGVRGDFSANEIDFNLTQSGAQGAGFMMWNHEPPHPGRMKNWDIHGNRFWFRNSTETIRVGGKDDSTTGTDVWDGDNDFYDNEYHVNVGATGTAYWRWGTTGQQGSAKTYSQWQAFHPGDNIPLALI